MLYTIISSVLPLSSSFGDSVEMGTVLDYENANFNASPIMFANAFIIPLECTELFSFRIPHKFTLKLQIQIESH